MCTHTHNHLTMESYCSIVSNVLTSRLCKVCYRLGFECIGVTVRAVLSILESVATKYWIDADVLLNVQAFRRGNLVGMGKQLRCKSYIYYDHC